MTTIQPNVTGRAAHSVAEVCLLLGLSREVVYGAIRDGRLVARKFGRRTLITDSDLRRFLDRLPRAGKAASARAAAS